VAAAAMATVSWQALADNTDAETVTVNGIVIASLEITGSTPLEFGAVARPNGTPPDVTTSAVISITNQSTGAFAVSYANNAAGGSGNPGSSNSTNIGPAPAPAEVTVTGEAGYAVAVTTSPAIVLLSNDASVSIAPPTGSITLSGGADTIYLGGQMSVTTAASNGAGTGTVNVTVTYD